MGQSWEGWGISDALVSPLTWKRVADVERISDPEAPVEPPMPAAAVQDYLLNLFERALSAFASRQLP